MIHNPEMQSQFGSIKLVKDDNLLKGDFALFEDNQFITFIRDLELLDRFKFNTIRCSISDYDEVKEKFNAKSSEG